MLSYWAQTYIKHEGTCPPPQYLDCRQCCPNPIITSFFVTKCTLHTIQYDTVYLTCSKKLTCSQLSPPPIFLYHWLVTKTVLRYCTSNIVDRLKLKQCCHITWHLGLGTLMITPVNLISCPQYFGQVYALMSVNCHQLQVIIRWPAIVSKSSAFAPVEATRPLFRQILVIWIFLWRVTQPFPITAHSRQHM